MKKGTEIISPYTHSPYKRYASKKVKNPHRLLKK